jgi:small conductance mechanosensitive channel
MNEIETNVADTVGQATGWLKANEGLLVSYVVNLATAIIILIVGAFLARMASKLVTRLMQARGLDITVTRFLSSIIRYIVLIITAIAAMSHVGIQTTSFIAVLGAAGLAVGLALQGSLSNFAAGVLLVIFRPFRSGEYVDLGGAEGTVQEIQIFSTTLLTADGKIIVVPNNRIISGNIVNYSREPNRRLQIIVGVAYSADIDEVKRVLNDVIAADKRILKEKGVTVRLNEMAASTLNFVVRVWTKNSDYGEVNFDLQENFKRALDRNNIGIPYPQMDVHLFQQNSGDDA